MSNQPRYVEVEILSPTHIGVAKEHHWVQFADFHYENKTVYRYDLMAYLKEKEDERAIHQITADLRNGRRINEPYLNELKARADQYQLADTPGHNGIHPQIRTGAGMPILPGSSLKGAVRSIMYKHLFQKRANLSQDDLLRIITAARQNGPTVSVRISTGQNHRLNNLSEEDLIGIYGNSLLKLFKFTDVEFLPEETGLYLNKIRTINGGANGTAEWKANHYNNVYECLKPKSQALGRVMIEGELYRKIRQANPNYSLPGANDFLVESPYQHLFRLINEHTRHYIKKEEAFLNRWEHEDNERIDFQTVKDHLDECADNQSCVIRMASGSGFHAVTGDWQNPTNHDSRRTDKGDVFNKTRRFAVDGVRFVPMGFIKLTLLNEEKGRKRLQSHSRTLAENLLQKKPSATIASPSKSSIPEKFTKRIGRNTDTIPAKVIVGSKGKIKVELWADGYEGKEYGVNYGSDLPEGSFIYVKFPDDRNKTVTYQRPY